MAALVVRTRALLGAVAVRSFASAPAVEYIGTKTTYTPEFKFLNTPEDPKDRIPCFQIMNPSGKLNEGTKRPEGITDEKLIGMYEVMTKLNVMDDILYNAQRQGRISFYMTSYGEEATHVGSAAALDPKDMIWGQYREAGVLMYRGYTLDEFMNQCCSNYLEPGKGRQMPVHYGSKSLNFQTISSPLATQIPQAVGGAYAYKLAGYPLCTVAYFGEGAASEGDFHAALNFAAALEAPCLFFCRNNGYAISTPAHEQYRGDAIAGRGVAYGINTIRVDGNDLFAVYHATEQARKYIIENKKPCLIEAMTYRGGHHSTSDDASRYRTTDELQKWQDLSPFIRLRTYLLENNLWTDVKETELRDQTRKDVLDALRTAEDLPKPALVDMFEDVYDSKPEHLARQEEKMKKHLAEFADRYPLNLHLTK